MIIEIENHKGWTIGAVRVHENNKEGYMEVLETKGEVDYADDDLDYIFDTNEELLRIQLLEEQNNLRSGNHIGFYHEDKEVKDLVQERSSYQALLKSFNKEDYYDCSVIINNYFGHIDYGEQFGYFKTHGEIVNILFSTLLSQLSPKDNSEAFTNFVTRQIKKIEWNLKHEHHIEDIEQCVKDGWLP